MLLGNGKAKGGRPRSDRRKAIEGIFWVLDNGAKWKDLPKVHGSKSSVHRAFKRWVELGAFEKMMSELGEVVKERAGFKLYECYVDGTFSKAKSEGEGIGCTKADKGLPIAVNTGSASPHESKRVVPLFDFMISVDFPERLIGDKAYDSDELDQLLAAKGVEMISTHRSNRKSENITQDGRPPSPPQPPLDRGPHHRLAAKLSPTLRPLGKIYRYVPRLCSPHLFHSSH